jgi:transposase
MIGLPSAVRVFLCTTPTDMRKSFDGLTALVRDHLRLPPLSGHLFVFRSRQGNRLKILYWDRTGLAIWYRRLEKGAFRWPVAARPGSPLEMTSAELMLMLEGIDLCGVRRQRRFTLPEEMRAEAGSI